VRRRTCECDRAGLVACQNRDYLSFLGLAREAGRTQQQVSRYQPYHHRSRRDEALF